MYNKNNFLIFPFSYRHNNSFRSTPLRPFLHKLQFVLFPRINCFNFKLINQCDTHIMCVSSKE